MNPWLFSFIVSLALLVLLADWKQINSNIHGGILSALFIQAESILAANLGLFKYNLVPLNMPGFSLFSNTINIFYTGIAFNIGVLIAQSHPRKMGYQLINAFVWSLFLIGFNFLSGTFDLVYYIRFKPYFVVRQFLLFLFIAWIKNNFALAESGIKQGDIHDY